MNTLVGVSREEIASFRKEILQLAPALGSGPTELADALFAVTSAGQRGAQAMDTLKKAAMASAVGLGDTRTIALASTAAVQAYGEANMDATKSLEILIGTIEQGNLEAESLAPVLGRIIGIAAEMGVAFEDVGAFIATFSRLGVNADEAATALRSTLATLQKPAKDAEEAFAAMGTSVEEVRRQIKEEGFIVAFQELVNKSREFGVDLVSIVPNVRALSGVLGVFGGDGQVAQEVLKGVSAAVGSLEQRFKAVQELDPAFAFAQMKAEIQALAIDLARDLLPAVIEIAGEIRSLAQWFRELNPETQTTAVRIAAITVATGPFLIVMGSVVRIIGTLIPLLVSMGAKLVALRASSSLLAMVLGPAGALGVGLGLLVKIIGDQYVASLERAIVKTMDFKGTLETLSLTGMQSNMQAAAMEVDRLFQDRMWQMERMASLQAMLNDPEVVGQPGQLSLLQAEVKRLNKEMGETEAILNSRIRLRDRYTNAIAKAIVKQQKDNKVLKQTSDAMDDVGDSANAMGKRVTTAVRQMSRVIQNELQLNFEFVAEEDFRAIADAMQREITALQGGAEAWAEYQKAMFEAQAIAELGPDATDAQVDAIRDLANELFDARASFGDFGDSVDQLDDSFQNAMYGWQDALRDTAGLFDQDSREAKALHTVLTALNIVMGVNAVLKQLAEGDVYSAIPRAIAVAAMVAALGVQTGAAGSSSRRSLQESQGTGSTLGFSDKKSESIEKATEITAAATSELVGINRGMLHALQAMQAGIGNAATQVVRGTGEVDVNLSKMASNPVGDLLEFLFDPLGILGGIFGGSAKIKDQGIIIYGGMLSDMINETLAQAFTDVKVKKHIFDDSDLKRKLGDVDSALTDQFSLVLESIADTVTEAALALGVGIEEVNTKIAEFEIATFEISLKDLEGDEYEEELLAVFGKIFDDLAGAVVPYIDQFQEVGEGLGETLVRVATSVQVFQESVTALGFAADTTDPEAFAQMAVGLVDLTGGVEEFISKFTTFFDKFASEEQKLGFATNQLTRAFDGVGLSVPATRDGMVDLMMSLDATTESGRAQIAMLLNIADVASEYYDLVEDAEEDRLEQAEELAAVIRAQRAALSDFIGVGSYAPLASLEDAFEEAMKAADALNASQREYAMIARSFNTQLRRMSAELTLDVLGLAESLFGSGADNALTSGINEGLEETREVANSVFDEWQRALEDIYNYTQDILLNENLTTLTPAEQLAEAQRQFDQLLASARAGDVDAAAALPDAADALLEEARFMYASGQQYTKIFDSTLAALKSVSMPGGISPTITETVDGIDYDRQADLIGKSVASELERYLMALDLAEGLRHLAEVTGRSVLDLADELGVPLRELVTILGVELGAIDVAMIGELSGIANMLGIGFSELISALGISMDSILQVVGVSLDAPFSKIWRQLDELADLIGVKLGALLRDLDVTPKFTNPREKEKYFKGGHLEPSIIGLKGSLASPYKGKYATGGYVSQTGMAMVHAGEFVINKAANNVSPAPDNSLTEAELREIRNVLVDIREDNKRYQEADLSTAREMEASMKDQAETTRRMANG
jgi:TP901 family phage tail tape measure protein